MVAWRFSRRGGPFGARARPLPRCRRLVFEILEQRSLLSIVDPSAIINRQVTNDPGVQQDPSIAVDPHDSQHLVVAYMVYSLVTTGYAGIGVAVSEDGGDTWQHTAGLMKRLSCCRQVCCASEFPERSDAFGGQRST